MMNVMRLFGVAVMVALVSAGCGSEPLPAPVVRESQVAPEPAPAPQLVDDVHRIKRNGTLSQLLRDAGLTGAEQAKWMTALQRGLDVRKLRANDVFHLWRSESGTVEQIVCDRSAWERVVIGKPQPRPVVVPFGDDAPMPVVRQPALEAVLQRDATEVASELVDIEVTQSLYQALIDSGWDAALAFELADVFAWDLDFYTDVQKGDRILALVDVRRRAGGAREFIQYGTLHAALYSGQVGKFSAYRFAQPDGRAAYFDESGRSLRKALLKSPLKYAHVTSKFGSRRHPVLGYTRQHAGVDLQASIGTPVWAIGDGKVSFAGWQNGYGKFVTVKHPNGLESAYAHLSQINVRVGQHVAQKTVIGASGNTGLSSGPHLHYGLKKNGVFVNPFSIKPERVEPLNDSELALFKKQIEPTKSKLGLPTLSAAQPSAVQAQPAQQTL